MLTPVVENLAETQRRYIKLSLDLVPIVGVRTYADLQSLCIGAGGGALNSLYAVVNKWSELSDANNP